jgi:hypothetical protein
MQQPRAASAPGPVPARLLLPTARSDLQATWHAERGLVTLSLWRGDVCVGTAQLSGEQAGELSAFLARHLGLAAVPPDAGSLPA